MLLNKSVYAIIIGYLASVFVGLVLGRIIFFIYMGEQITPQIAYVDFFWFFAFFSLGFIVSMIAPKPKWLHSLLAFIFHFLISGLLVMPLVARLDQYLKKIDPEFTGLKDPASMDTPREAFYVLLYSEDSRSGLLSFLVLFLGIILAYAFEGHRKNRAANKMIFNELLKPFGFTFIALGFIGYCIPFLYLLIFGVVPLVLSMPFVLLIAVVGFLLYRSDIGFLSIFGGLILGYLALDVILALEQYGNMSILLFLFTGGIVLLGSAKLFRIGRRTVAITRIVKGVPDILLLRSFKDDNKTFHSSFIKRLARYFSLSESSYVSKISNWFKKSPWSFAAVSNPFSPIPVWLSGFIHAPGDWEARVEGLIRESKCLLMILGDTKGVLTEFRMILENNTLEKLILILQADINFDAWKKFWVGVSEQGYQFEIPQYKIGTFAIYFSADKKPVLETIMFPDEVSIRSRIFEIVRQKLGTSEGNEYDLHYDPI